MALRELRITRCGAYLSSIAFILTIGWAASSSENLTCYLCHTLVHGPVCQHVFQNVQLVAALPKHQCAIGEKHCIVRRYGYAPNGTDTKVWMMERNCSRACTSECVITGDRMKLHLCTSCCQQNLCNVDNGVVGLRTALGAVAPGWPFGHLSISLVMVLILSGVLQRTTLDVL